MAAPSPTNPCKNSSQEYAHSKSYKEFFLHERDVMGFINQLVATKIITEKKRK
jgi:hypothetical protein